MARHLLKRVRELWAEEIEDESELDGSVDSANLIVVYKDLLDMQKRKLEVNDEVILTTIEESPAGVAKNRRTAADVFLMVTEREASEQELDCLHGLVDVTEIASKVKSLMETGTLCREDATDLDIVQGDGVEDDTLCVAPAAEPLVDEEWIEEFVDAYEREPFVHEYMHLRGGAHGPLEDAYTIYAAALGSMREVYSDYLNEDLKDSKFVRLYTPVVYTDADLVKRVVLEVTDSEEYATAMKERLSHLYKVLFGDALTDADSGYIFEKWVRGDRLSLTCDLNQIIVGFKDEADAHAADMVSLWESVLGRKPLEPEIARHKEEYRVDAEAARAAVHAALVKSREFTHVITTRIQDRKPEMPMFEVYELLDRILQEFDLVATPIDTCIDAL